jgi:hypothetical protein
MSCSSDRRSSSAIDKGSAQRAFEASESRTTLALAHKPTRVTASLQPNRREMYFSSSMVQNTYKGCIHQYRRLPKSKSSGNENGVGFMHCALCQSVNLAEFTAEMMIHFSGLRNIDHPGIPAFPKVLVCLNCGSSQFTVPARKLTLLANRTATNDGPVPLGGRVESPALRVA